MEDLKNEIILFEQTKVGSERVKELWLVLDDILSIAECRGRIQADMMFERGLEKIWPLSEYEIEVLEELYNEYV